MENKEKFSHDVEEELVKEIKVKYFSDDIPRLKINPKGDLIDLYAAKDITINEMDEALIPLGVAMELPEGFRADLSPRSSTFKKWGIIVTNSIGKIWREEYFAEVANYLSNKYDALTLFITTPNLYKKRFLCIRLSFNTKCSFNIKHNFNTMK